MTIDGINTHGERKELGQPERWAARREWTMATFAQARDPRNRNRRRALEAIIIAHIDVADSVARRYKGRPQDAQDLRQVAYVGLLKAVNRFDQEKGSDFVSFAVPTISGEIKRHLRDNGWVIRPPRPIQELRARVSVATSTLEQTLGRIPTTAELALHLECDTDAVHEAITSQYGLRPASLDVETEETGLSLLDTLSVEDDGLRQAELSAMLSPALGELTARERRIVYLRFYEEKTQQEIADQVGVTQMQVSRLLTALLGTLRTALSEDRPVRRSRAGAARPSALPAELPRSA
ncbi:MAG TPA: sigma-70 family RNA polymerase sigma factor [Glaciihabitans sp.]|jgi:RNA polymerase sigma-B factor|nr:sigma-70 family RNA polymerase sigma factor [Glaciihabitans sp.]